MAKSKTEEARENFAKWAEELKDGESLTVFIKHGNSSTLCNHHGQTLARANGYGYDKDGACLDSIATLINKKQCTYNLEGFFGPDKQEAGNYIFKRILAASSLMNVPISVWQITKK